MELRYYQREALDGTDRYPGLIRALAQHRSALFVMPTGSGKTIVFAHAALRFVQDGGRVLVLAHRQELLEQAADKIGKAVGLDCAVEKAERSAMGALEPVTVGSVQTLMRLSRLENFRQDHYSHIIVDEAQHTCSDSYLRILSYFSHARVAGCTATPDRGDMQDLGRVFETLAYEYTLPQAIQDGFLCPIRCQMLPLKIELAEVGRRDWSDIEVGEALAPYVPQIATELWRVASGRKLLVFAPLCKIAQTIRDALAKVGFRSYYASGEDRSQMPEWNREGPGAAMVNAMLLCLDLETEILTETGWVSCRDMTLQHLVANWRNDGSVFFERPIEIVNRLLGDGEHMVSVDSRCVNFRVTNTHRMLVACGAGKRSWKKVAAQELASRHILPSCGIAAPVPRSIDIGTSAFSNRRVSANAYNIRKLTGARYSDSMRLATQRERTRNGLARAQPHELTTDECRLIGFWIADGSINKNKRRGGVEYVLCQSPTYPHIVAWIDALIARLGLSVRRRVKEADPKAILWSLCRGTGGGSLLRSGLYRIEPYLNKNGTDAMRALNEAQFDAMVEGYWYGDGHHGQAADGFPRSVVFNDTKHAWIELLCSLGPVRGWRCAMYHLPSRNPKHKDQWRLRMIKGMRVHLSASTEIVHEPFRPERVWCVRTTSKNIITRRRGKVTVMGNTEGYDEPRIDAVCVLRPTKVRSLYAQMIGRGTRILQGKDYLLVPDFLWHSERHTLCRPAHLFCENQDIAVEIDKRLEASAGGDPIEVDAEAVAAASEAVLRDREKALAKKLAEQRRKKARLVDPLQFAVSIGDERMADWKPALPSDSAPATLEQQRDIELYGVSTEGMTTGQAADVLAKLHERDANGMASPKQIRFLERYGIPHAGRMTRGEAGSLCGRIQANHFRLPDDMAKLVERSA